MGVGERPHFVGFLNLWYKYSQVGQFRASNLIPLNWSWKEIRSALVRGFGPSPLQHPLVLDLTDACGLSTFFCPHQPLLRCSFCYLILRVGFWLHHEHHWLMYFSNLMEHVKHYDSSGNNTITPLDDSAPNLAPDGIVAPAMESIIPQTISWQLGQYLLLSEIWSLENFGYYLCPIQAEGDLQCRKSISDSH